MRSVIRHLAWHVGETDNARSGKSAQPGKQRRLSNGFSPWQTSDTDGGRVCRQTSNKVCRKISGPGRLARQTVLACGCAGHRSQVDARQGDELPHACECQEEDCEGDALQQLGAAQQGQPQRQPCPPACAARCPQHSKKTHLGGRPDTKVLVDSCKL